jgi:hypothetical protein
MTKVFYEKVGRRYRPVLEYDNEVMDAFPKGDHLVSVRSGCTSRRFRVDPALAPMIAAGLYAEDAICRKIQEATELRPASRTIDEDTLHRWQQFVKTIPEEHRLMFTHGSARDAAEAGVRAMQEEADRLMQNDVVRKAYEQFLLVCKLSTRQHD